MVGEFCAAAGIHAGSYCVVYGWVVGHRAFLVSYCFVPVKEEY